MDGDPTIEDIYEALRTRGDVNVTRHSSGKWSAVLMPSTLEGDIASCPEADSQLEVLWGLLERCWERERQVTSPGR